MGRYHLSRIEDVEHWLPERMHMEPRPSENPVKRPYPEYAQDLHALSEILAELPNNPAEYRFTDRDARLRMKPHGILFFHALDIQHLVLSKHNFMKDQAFCVYVEFECQDTLRCSDPVYCSDVRKVRIDHSVHMQIEPSEFRLDDNNNFFIHVYAFQDPGAHYLIGSQKIHIANCIRELHGISSTKLKNSLTLSVGTLHYEFAWAYGSFGYGYSNQLRNLRMDIYENVCHSMFPRIRPSPHDLVANRMNVRTPKRLRLVNLQSLLLKRAKPKPWERKAKVQPNKKPKKKGSKGEHEHEAGFEAKSMIFRRVKFCRGTPTHVSLSLDIHQKFMEDDFNESYGEYLCLRNRRDRLRWLTNFEAGRLRDVLETNAYELFRPFKDVREVRRTLGVERPLACPPEFLEHTDPKRTVDHFPIHPVNLERGDLQFVQQKLASAPRFSGYLNYVFGYQPVPYRLDTKELEFFDFKLPPGVENMHNQLQLDDRPLRERCFLRTVSFCLTISDFFWWVWNFAFPTFREEDEPELPEISLTMPSPSQSTTDFHSLCTQKQVYTNESGLNITRRRVCAYIHKSKRSQVSLKDNDYVEEYELETLPFTSEKEKSAKK